MTSHAVVGVRPATEADSVSILAWRNDPATRAMSTNTDEVRWAEHASWYGALLANPARHLLVGWVHGDDDDLIGMVRFDRLDTHADVRGRPSATLGADAVYEMSVNMAPHARGRRLAVPLLRTAANWLQGHAGGAAVVAWTRVENEAMRRSLLGAGYVEAGRDDEWAHFITWLGADVHAVPESRS